MSVRWVLDITTLSIRNHYIVSALVPGGRSWCAGTPQHPNHIIGRPPSAGLGPSAGPGETPEPQWATTAHAVGPGGKVNAGGHTDKC